MTQVRLVDRDQGPSLARPHYHEGDPESVTAGLAQVGELGAKLPVLGGVYKLGAEARTKEPVFRRTSAGAGCRSCFDTGDAVAIENRVSVTMSAALRQEAPMEEAFPARADQVLRWVDAFAAGRGHCSEADGRDRR